MTPADFRLLAAAVFGIGLSVVLIVRGRLHPFVGLLCGAFAAGLVAGESIETTAKAVRQGTGDILGGTGLVVALGLTLGAMLQLSGAASAIGAAMLRPVGRKGAAWASLAAGVVIGLPLFFETGLVLLLPIIVAAAKSFDHGRSPDGNGFRLRLMLSALAGLSVVHALVPPHPGPLLAVAALGADLGRTMFYGLVIAIPTAIIAGPLLAKVTTPGVDATTIIDDAPATIVPEPSFPRSLTILLLPVFLIAGGQLGVVLPTALITAAGLFKAASDPVVALLVANLVALPLLFGRRVASPVVQNAVWSEAMRPAGAILLAIGAGGALKQVLVSIGLADLLARVSATSALSPIFIAWLVAVGVRLATGSATVATITTVGIISGLAAGSGVEPEWLVLAVGCGSVFFSHVNDPGFWLVKSYLGVSTADTFRTWSTLETVISVVGLAFIMLVQYLL